MAEGSNQQPFVDNEVILAQFTRLLNEVLKGSVNRNSFRRWEIEILLDIDGCELKDGAKREILRRYQRAAQRLLEKGATTPLKLSEYLESQRVRRERLADELQQKTA